MIFHGKYYPKIKYRIWNGIRRRLQLIFLPHVGSLLGNRNMFRLPSIIGHDCKFNVVISASFQHIELFISLPCRRRGEHIWARIWLTCSQYTYNARSQCNRYRIKKTFSYNFRQIFHSGNMYFRSISTLFFCGVRDPSGPCYVLQWILNRYGLRR